MIRIYFLISISFLPVTAHCATWMLFTKNHSATALFYFDKDTVAKHGDSVTLWEKVVYDLNQQDTNGIFSTANRVTYLCSKRTSQTLTYSTYNKKGEFVGTYTTPGEAIDIVPDSIGEGILKIVCAKDFPRNHSNEFYRPIKDNDIYKYTTNYFEYINIAIKDASPSTSVWYSFSKAFNNKHLYFFDKNSIDKNENGVMVWILGINEISSPDSDGSYSTGSKATYSCSKRVLRTLVSSLYDINGKFIRSIPGSGEDLDFPEGSIAEGVQQAVCSKDFPLSNESDLYTPVENNDAYAFARQYFEFVKAAKSDPAPK